MSMPAAQAVGHSPGWLLPSAYHLFGLRHPWSNDSDAFATTETGQLLINRSAQCQACLSLGIWNVSDAIAWQPWRVLWGLQYPAFHQAQKCVQRCHRMYMVGLSGPFKHG